jgi:hypothetical protein
MLFQFEITESNEAAFKLFGVEHSHVFSYVTVSFKAFHPFESRGGREVYGRCEFFDSKTRIVLKGTQDA